MLQIKPNAIEHWQTEPTEKSLALHDVAVWQFDLDSEQPAISDMKLCLSNHELARFEQYKEPISAQRYLYSRYAIRTVLSRYEAKPPSQLAINLAETGKPYLNASSLQFNLSHCGHIGLLAVSKRHAIGIDLERYKAVPNYAKIAQRVFRPSLLQQLEQSNDTNKEQLFIELWTEMEASQKAWGNGVFATPADMTKTSMFSFLVNDKFVASLALAGVSNTPKIGYFQF